MLTNISFNNYTISRNQIVINLFEPDKLLKYFFSHTNLIQFYKYYWQT